MTVDPIRYCPVCRSKSLNRLEFTLRAFGCWCCHAVINIEVLAEEPTRPQHDLGRLK